MQLGAERDQIAPQFARHPVPERGLRCTGATRLGPRRRKRQTQQTRGVQNQPDKKDRRRNIGIFLGNCAARQNTDPGLLIRQPESPVDQHRNRREQRGTDHPGQKNLKGRPAPTTTPQASHPGLHRLQDRKRQPHMQRPEQCRLGRGQPLRWCGFEQDEQERQHNARHRQKDGPGLEGCNMLDPHARQIGAAVSIARGQATPCSAVAGPRGGRFPQGKRTEKPGFFRAENTCFPPPC